MTRFLLVIAVFSLSSTLILSGILFRIEKGQAVACSLSVDSEAQDKFDWVSVEINFDAIGGKTMTLKDMSSGRGLWVKLNPRLSNYIWRKLFLEGHI